MFCCREKGFVGKIASTWPCDVVDEGTQREIAARKFRRVNVGVAGAEDFGVEIAVDRFGVRDVGS